MYFLSFQQRKLRNIQGQSQGKKWFVPLKNGKCYFLQKSSDKRLSAEEGIPSARTNTPRDGEKKMGRTSKGIFESLRSSGSGKADAEPAGQEEEDARGLLTASPDSQKLRESWDRPGGLWDWHRRTMRGNRPDTEKTRMKSPRDGRY